MASNTALQELSGLDSSSTVLLVATEAHPDAFIRNLDIELKAARNFAAALFPHKGSLDEAPPMQDA